ncbi:hypothetical protein F4859DRAFT_466361 [Xylaria cf. heliscus]|nr:hypothetical protein F4859DRAFT_466361 [Xylaria cf. heliscus]
MAFRDQPQQSFARLAPSPTSGTLYGLEERDSRYDTTGRPLLGDQQGKTMFVSHQSDYGSSMPALGKPTAKTSLSLRGVSAFLISLICLGLTVWAVASDSASWYLGVGNNQLIVVGFLISTMNLCLNSVTPTLFLLLEAKIGPSVLQNYDGILRNSPMASRLNLAWRAALTLNLALPILLSVAYKAFVGGESSIHINSANYIPNTTFYGWWPPPSLDTGAFEIGPSLHFNATLPFRVASTPGADGVEPPLPVFPQSYGQNVLLLSNESTAVLDTLQTDYIAKVQDLLRLGESWTISAPVSASVATFNRSKINDPDEFSSAYVASCNNSQEDGQNSGDWTLTTLYLYNSWYISLLNQKLHSDQSVQYISLAPGALACEDMPPYTQLYNLERRQCHGTWRITRAGTELLSGSCEDGKLPWSQQQAFEWTILDLQSWYMPTLIEAVSAFSGGGNRGNRSSWWVPSTATAVASMLWSREVSLSSYQWRPFDSSNFNMSRPYWPLSNGSYLSFEEIGIVYPVDQALQSVVYTRSTLRKSPLLYAVLAIQPLLILIILALTVMLYSVPIGRGFGLVSIMSGINRQTLDRLAGASLSGELTKPIRLAIDPVQHGQKAAIEYHILSLSDMSRRKKKIEPKLVYE